MLNHPKTYKWDNRGAGLFHSLLSQKDTQEKLDKLRFDLGLLATLMQFKRLSKNSLKSYQSVVTKLLELKREIRSIRNQKSLDIVELYSSEKKNLPELLSSFKRIKKTLI